MYEIEGMDKKEKKRIAVLGSTGSIGTQALQVIAEHADLYEAYALTANNQVELLIKQARKFQPEIVVIANEKKYGQLKEALSDLPIKVYTGVDALCQVVEEGPVDMVLTALVGMVVFKERPDLPALLGIGLILIGVAVIHLFSKTVSH